jgi:hypothetical protein
MSDIIFLAGRMPFSERFHGPTFRVFIRLFCSLHKALVGVDLQRYNKQGTQGIRLYKRSVLFDDLVFYIFDIFNNSFCLHLADLP